MAERKPNEVKIIAWHMVAKNVIKFANDEQSYKCNDKVLAANDFAKYPLSKGTSVEVGIQENVITFLRKQKNDAPKSQGTGSEEAYEPTPEEEAGTAAPAPEAKKEEPKVEAPSSDAKELTVFAVAANKKVVKFTELKDDGWYTIDEKIQAQDYATIGLIAKNKVKVTFADKMVTSLVKVASEPAETSQDKPREAQLAEPTSSASVPAQAVKKWTPASTYDTAEKQTSIEAQAAVNGANQVVGRVAAMIEPKPTANVINAMIKAIAEANFALIQELKNK
jgi:hypothetical protein